MRKDARGVAASGSPSVLRLVLLGPPAATRDGRPVVFARRKSLGLLARLAVAPGLTIPRPTLTSLLWGGVGPEQATDSLRHSLTDIRHALGRDAASDVLQSGRDGVVLAPGAVEVDVVAFERLANDPARLEDATRRYAGDFLWGFELREPAFDAWRAQERRRLRALAVRTLTTLLTRHTAADAWPAAIDAAVRLLALEPLDEATHRTLMRLYAVQGQRAAALRQYQACVEALERELGAEPGADTKLLYREILQTATPAAPAADVPDVPLLVGRDAELTAMTAMLDRPARASAWAVVGEAGIGKTALTTAVLAAAARRGARVISGQCFESERAMPLGPWMAAMRGAGLIAHPALQEALPSSARAELARIFPEIGTPPPGPGDLTGLFEAFRVLFDQLARTRDLVVALDDVHWADETSLQLLAFLLRRGPSNVCAVVTLRPEALDDARGLSRLLLALEREDRMRHLALGPLDHDAVVQLVRALRSGLPADSVAEFAERVWTVSAGHALMAVETARSLEPGERSAARLPRRVEVLIGSRLGALTRRAGEAAGVAAVVGRSFDFRLIAAAAGLDDDATATVVEELVRRYVLHEIDGRLDFRHARIRDVAYARLTGARRAALHRRVAEAIERVHARDLDDHAVALAGHYREAAAWDRVARWARRAGELAFARFANRDSATSWEQALDAIARLPRTSETVRSAIDVRFELHNVWSRLRDLDRSRRVLAEAGDLARALGDRTRLRQALVHLSSLSVRRADYRGALDAALEAQGIPGAARDVAARVRTSYDSGVASCAIGEVRRACELLEANVRALGARPSERFGTVCSLYVSSCTWFAIAAAELGDYAAARERGRLGIDAAEKLGDHHGWVVAVCGVWGRDFEVAPAGMDAIATMEGAVARCGAAQVNLLLPYALTALARVYGRAGRVADARRALAGAIEAGDGLIASPDYLASNHGPYLVEAAWLAQGAASARAFAERGLALARERKHHGVVAKLLRLLGDIEAGSSRGGLAAARARYEEAATLTARFEMRPEAARVQLGLARVLAAGRQRAAARAHAAAATREFRAMGMAGGLAAAAGLSTC